MLPVVPMFHVNAWGLPFTCTMFGATQVFPGPFLDPDSLLELLVVGARDGDGRRADGLDGRCCRCSTRTPASTT